MANSQSDVQQRQRARPGSRDFRHRLKRFLRLAAALPVFLPCSAWAAKWEIVPTLAAEERYTDNLSLAPDDSKQSDWITQVTPGIAIAATGARLRFNAAYAPEFLYYARGHYDNQVYQRGSALGNAELAKELLFVDFGAKVNQYNASLQEPQSTSNANATGNRATVGTYFASPYLRRDFGSNVRGEARFTGSVVDSDDQSLLANSVADRIDLRLNSGPAYKLLTWNFDYFRENIDYESGQSDISTEVATANAKRLITPTVGLLAQAGYDRYELGSAEASLEGSSWSVGMDWIPSPRTRFAATAGRRFYGDDYTFDISHRTRRTTSGVAYRQYVSTTRSEFFVLDPASTAGYLNTLFSSQFPDPVAREEAVRDFIARTALPSGLNSSANFFTSELFLAKRWQASAGTLGVRNVLIAYVYKETREVLSAGATGSSGAGDFAAGNSVDQTGASFQWNWRVTGLDTWNLGAGYSRNDFPGTSRIDKLRYVAMGISRQFEPRLIGSLNYRRNQSDSNVSEGNYTENAVYATIQKRF